jgi:hypothetical protein
MEKAFLFSNSSLPEIARAIGATVKDGTLMKNYGGGLRATIVQDSYTEQTLLRYSQKIEEETVVLKEISLNGKGVHVGDKGVIFAGPANKGELVSFSRLTKDGMPILDGLEKYKGGVRKAAWKASEKRRELFGPEIFS